MRVLLFVSLRFFCAFLLCQVNTFRRRHNPPSFVLEAQWATLSDEDKDRFALLCPEFIIEVRSKSDGLEDLKNKMASWIQNGCQLAWLIDPLDKNTYTLRPGRSVEMVSGFDQTIKGENVVEGFELDMRAVIR